jgi:hypothetical protein
LRSKEEWSVGETPTQPFTNELDSGVVNSFSSQVCCCASKEKGKKSVKKNGLGFRVVHLKETGLRQQHRGKSQKTVHCHCLHVLDLVMNPKQQTSFLNTPLSPMCSTATKNLHSKGGSQGKCPRRPQLTLIE